MAAVFKRKNSNNIDMTEGKIIPLIIRFSLPLILGDIFQQFYNLTDTWVLGNYATNEEYAAVGSTTFICGLIIKSFIGLATGFGIVIAKRFGAGDREAVRQGSQTAFTIGIVCSVLLTAFAFWVMPYVLKLTKVPTEIYDYTRQYLSIIFSFITAQVLYNMGAGILRAVGDSRKPFIFLVISALTNVGLDLYLVMVKGQGIKGAAYATVFSQCLSAVLVLIELFTTKLDVRISFREWKFNKSMCKEMIVLGIPTALQMSLISLANTFVQSYINVLGVDFVSGFATYHKIDELLFTSANSFGIACMTFASQNLGAKQGRRALEGIKKTLLIGCVYVLVMGSLVYIFAPQLSAIFNAEPQVVINSTYIMRITTPFVLFSTISHIMMSGIRGAGKTVIPFAYHVAGNVGVRLLYVSLATRFIGSEASSVVMAYPVGWFATFVLILIHFERHKKELYLSV